MIETRWTLQFRFNLLPWKLLAQFTGVSRYTLDGQSRVLRQQDYWDFVNLRPGANGGSRRWSSRSSRRFATSSSSSRRATRTRRSRRQARSCRTSCCAAPRRATAPATRSAATRSTSR